MSLKRQALLLALLCAAAAACMRRFAPAGMLLYCLALPLEGAGWLLRRLSLWNAFGNALAWAFYLGLCLAPLLCAALRKRRGRALPCAWMGALLSAALFFVLYLFINPALLRGIFGPVAVEEGLLVCKTGLSIFVWSIAAAWWVLAFLRRGARPALCEGLALLVKATGALLILSLCYSSLYALLGCVQASGVKVFDAGGAPLTGLSLLGSPFSPWTLDFPAAVQVLMQAVPQMYLLALVPAALALLESLGAEPWSAEAAAHCDTLAARARMAVCACLLCAVAGNFLQLLWAGEGRSFHISLPLPIFELMLALAALLISGGLREGRELKLDNDAII